MKNYISKGKKWGLVLLVGAICSSCDSELDQKPYYFTAIKSKIKKRKILLLLDYVQVWKVILG